MHAVRKEIGVSGRTKELVLDDLKLVLCYESDFERGENMV